MDLKEIANQTIPGSKGQSVLKTKAGITDDIVAGVLAAYKDSRGQLNKFAPHLQAVTLRQTLFNVWNFWKSNIVYQTDPPGTQYIKEPKAMWHLKKGDCKSLSVAVMSTLNSLGIKAAFRFTSYNSNTEFPTHVYVVVKYKNEIIPVDCVWKKFGEQKPFTKNWDYNMPTDIYQVSGVEEKQAQPIRKKRVPTAQAKLIHQVYLMRKRLKNCKCNEPKVGTLVIPDDPRICEGIAGLALYKQGLELEREIHLRDNGVGAIGDTVDNAYTIQITGLHNALSPYFGWRRKKLVKIDRAKAPHSRDHIISGVSNNGYVITDGNGESIACAAHDHQAISDSIEGFFGNIFKAIKKTITAPAKLLWKGIKKTITAPAKFLMKGVKAVGKLVGKVLKAPARRAINESLPGYAPFFLYTYITDPKVLAKLPEQVRIKKEKAEYYKKIIVGKLGIADTTFNQVVRNGIMTQFKMTPEQVIAKWMKDTNFQIGWVTAAIGAAAGLLGKGLKLIMGDTGEHIATDAEQYAPTVEDWGTLTEAARAELAAQQNSSTQPPLTTEQLQQQVYNQQPAQSNSDGYYSQGNYSRPISDNAGAPADPLNQVSYDENGKAIYPASGGGFSDTKDLNNVDIKPQTAGGGSTGLLIGAAAIGLLLMSSKSKK